MRRQHSDHPLAAGRAVLILLLALGLVWAASPQPPADRGQAESQIRAKADNALILLRNQMPAKPAAHPHDGPAPVPASDDPGDIARRTATAPWRHESPTIRHALPAAQPRGPPSTVIAQAYRARPA